jgi:hypothetical protein
MSLALWYFDLEVELPNRHLRMKGEKGQTGAIHTDLEVILWEAVIRISAIEELLGAGWWQGLCGILEGCGEPGAWV